MLQGIFGQKLARHFSLPRSSSLLLRPDPNIQLAMTRMRMPNGFPGAVHIEDQRVRLTKLRAIHNPQFRFWVWTSWF
jgi:hypothetical protein